MSRLNELRKIILEMRLQYIIITDRYNMNYFSGYTGDTGVLLISKNEQFLFTDFRYIEKAKKEANSFKCIDVSGKKYSICINEIIRNDNNKLLDNNKSLVNNKLVDANILKNSNLVGYEYNNISHSDYEEYNTILAEINFLLYPIKNELDIIRGVKEEYEIANISKAAYITDKAFSFVLDIIKVGMTEKEIANEIEYFIKKQGAMGISFDTIVASGPNSSMPHAIPSDRKIQKGDLVTIDMGCIYNGYCSDMTRTIGIGTISDEKVRVYNIVLEAQLKALESIRVNVSCSQIDKIARDTIANYGYGDCFGHGLGHSVGLFIHEEPRFSSKSKDVTQVNNVITVEPGIYISGKFGVRIEDLIVVKEDGIINLCNSKKELIII